MLPRLQVIDPHAIDNYIYLDEAVVKEETDEARANARVAFNLLLHNVSDDVLCSFASLVVVSIVERRGSRWSALGCRYRVRIPVACLARVGHATQQC
jgi:hypothetical protein